MKAIILTLGVCATAHLVVAMVMSLFARHRVKYLSIAWIMGIFAFLLLGALVYTCLFQGRVPMLHPAVLMLLTAACFLQSIYPLSIPMPAFLQWERMWAYALPAIIAILLYGGALLLGMKPVSIHSGDEFFQHLFTVDMILRLVNIGVGAYYIINILRLPRRLSRANVPSYLVVYSNLLGLNAIYFEAVVILPFSPARIIIALCVFTVLNLYMCFRTLESLALELPKPQIIKVECEPEEQEIKEAENDFNEANQKRFERVEHWMQHNPDRWRDNTFGRDQLCRETGFNRHLLLQCVRSAGYYNTHEYINSYRVKDVKRMIETGNATNLTECLTAGFGAVKTLRSSFQRETGQTIDEFLAQHKR